MAETDTRKPRFEPELLADLRNPTESRRYLLVEIYYFEPLYSAHWLKYPSQRTGYIVTACR